MGTNDDREEQCEDEGVPNDEAEPDYRTCGLPPDGYAGQN
jgi:hypothetical protein